MAVDPADELAHSAMVAFAEAVEDALAGRTRTWLADQLGVNGSTVTRLLNGDTKEIRVDQVVALERILGTPRGQLFRAMGLIEDPTTFEEWIESQPRLSADTRRSLRAVYEAGLRP